MDQWLKMTFQNDGAPCHFARDVRANLNATFPQIWIGRGRPIAWPARSPDLNPVDFFIWGYYKELVHHREYNALDELKDKQGDSQEKIKEQVDSFRRLRRHFLKRCRLCIRVGGRNFEHL